MSEYLPELERLRSSIRLQDAVARLGGEDNPYAFNPTKTAGTVRISAGNLPEIHWEDGGGAAAQPAAQLALPPPAAGAALGVPQPEGFDLLAGLGGGPAAVSQQQQQQYARAAMPAVLAISLPEISSSLRLPTASQATLAKHALLPAGSFGGSSRHAERQQPPPALHQRPLYPELAELEPPPPLPPAAAAAAAVPPPQQVEAALTSLSLGVQQQPGATPPWPTPSPYGELQLGPQEIGVTSAPRPTQPLPPGATCCTPGGAPGAIVPAPPPSGGVAEVKKLQQIRDVHISVALMDEFMRWAGRGVHRQRRACAVRDDSAWVWRGCACCACCAGDVRVVPGDVRAVPVASGGRYIVHWVQGWRGSWVVAAWSVHCDWQRALQRLGPD